MKRLTLDETWRLCLSMWRWIAKQKKEDSSAKSWLIKDEWLEKHGYKEDDISCSCFFCDYAEPRKKTYDESMCTYCPGNKVDKTLGRLWCQNKDIDWRDEPIVFYNKLRSLNRKRLTKKKK